MEFSHVYDSILSKINDDLTPLGFKRSGKGGFFYRFSAESKVGYAIEMQKSAFNNEVSCSFTFNLSYIALYEVKGITRDKLTVSVLRQTIKKPLCIKRIGQITRGRDYWWKVNNEILKNFPICEYYDRFLKNDNIKCGEYLIGEAAKKEAVYSRP